jgi:hypothetical protein
MVGALNKIPTSMVGVALFDSHLSGAGWGGVALGSLGRGRC